MRMSLCVSIQRTVNVFHVQVQQQQADRDKVLQALGALIQDGRQVRLFMHAVVAETVAPVITVYGCSG